MRSILSIFLTLTLTIGLSACGEDKKAEMPPPVQLTQEAIGYYCNMTVVDHHGPKGQIQLNGKLAPIWFSSARDTIAFTLLPEESKDIAAIYVTDMSKADSWENPESSVWIDAKTAHYVIGSSKRGGMGAPEPVPFSSRETAKAFAHVHGGEIVAFSDIPEDSILGMVEIDGNHEAMDMGQSGEHEGMDHTNGQMKMDQDG